MAASPAAPSALESPHPPTDPLRALDALGAGRPTTDMTSPCMQSGDIIEFQASAEHRLGVITGELGKNKLIVTAAGGAQMRPSREDVTLQTGLRADPSSAPMMTRALSQLEEQIQAALTSIALDELWEMVLELGEDMDLEALSDLALGSTQAHAKLAMLRALRQDGVYFKQRKKGFEPRERAQVQQLREQLLTQQRRERERADFVQAVASLLRIQPSQDRGQQAQALQAQDTTFRQHLETLADYAACGEEFARRERAEELLGLLEGAVDLRGRGPQRAFSLMVALGLWGVHENLWMHRYHVRPEFKPELLELAQALATQPWTPEPWRQDLRELVMFTIDDDSTRDLDDALSVEPRQGGGWIVGVHIADPSAYQAPLGPLELEGRSRGTSLYLPTGTIPMLPLALSEGALSLIAGVERAAMSTLVQVDEDLQVLDVSVQPSVVRVSERLSYDGVDAILAGQQPHPLRQQLQTLAAIAAAYGQRRAQAGAVDLAIPEVKLTVLDPQADAPQVKVEVLDSRSPSRQLVAELMILASAAMGELCAAHQIPVIYRTQEAPDGEFLDEATRALPEGLVRDFALRRKLRPASISTQPGPHFGLGVPRYVQATSPIRRFSDYLCQQQLKAHLAGLALPYSEQELLRVAAMVEHTTREARILERETVRYWTIYVLQQRLHEPLEATVVDYRDDGKAFVFIEALALREKVDLRERVPLGTRVVVKAIKANPRQDMLRLVQVHAPGASDDAQDPEQDLAQDLDLADDDAARDDAARGDAARDEVDEVDDGVDDGVDAAQATADSQERS